MTFREAAETVAGFVSKFRPVTHITDDVTETEFVLPDDLKTLINQEVRYRYMESSHLTTYGTIKAARVNKRTKRVELLIEPNATDKLPRVFEPGFVVAFVYRVTRRSEF